MQNFLWLIPVLPLAGSIACGILHARGGEGRKLAGPLASLAVFGAFCVAIGAFSNLGGETEQLVYDGYTWIATGDLTIGFSLLVDPLSAFMALIVTGVGFLIHVYSIGYMAHDEGKAKYFAFLNLFIFAMSLLVLGASLPLLFVGWEGVGLMSYLLIGFWSDKDDGMPAKAGQKAFITNRVGDLAFVLGMFMLFTHAGTLDFAGLERAPAMPEVYATIACLLLFVGATGKSAQIPLFVWLPDAMAGPTPVSALIHAATMVTAGVYMVCRCSFLFAQALPEALIVVAIVGGITALFAATIALVQRDIKKVLAYSTISQLGYMFLACGVGAFSAAIFHVGTHAFFKALLFLGAGSVIHGMHDEQDIRRYGGLRTKMPWTYWTFLVGSLCLAGFPLSSGFFSKDEILWHTVQSGTGLGYALWGLGALTALMTAFYTFRLFSLTFLGEPRWDAAKPPHESPRVMTVPLVVLAVLAAFGGALGIPEVFAHGANWIAGFLAPSLAVVHPLAHGDTSEGLSHSAEGLFIAYSSVIAIVGVAAGFLLYRRGFARGEKLRERFALLHLCCLGKWFVDEIYELFVLAPLALLSRASGAFDLGVVDGAVNGVAEGAQALAKRTVRAQDGRLQSYAVWMAGGTAVLLLVLVYQLW